jgi:hypothetical protein
MQFIGDMKFYFAILFSLSASISYCQADTLKLLVGIWDVCVDLNKLDTNCSSPFSFFYLKQDAQFEGPGATCNGKEEPTLGTWTYRNSGLYFSSYKGSCFEMPASGHYNLRFISRNLIYYVYTSTAGENGGQPMYFVLKRRK